MKISKGKHLFFIKMNNIFKSQPKVTKKIKTSEIADTTPNPEDSERE